MEDFVYSFSMTTNRFVNDFEEFLRIECYAATGLQRTLSLSASRKSKEISTLHEKMRIRCFVKQSTISSAPITTDCVRPLPLA